MGTIGENIIYFRKKRHLSQCELAKLMGVSQNAVYGWENNKRKPSIDILKKMSEILRITLYDIVEGEGTEEIIWIPINDRFPNENQKVWVTLEYHGGDRRIDKCIYRGGSFMKDKYISCDNIVVAWMPRFVPEPYRERQGGG